MEKLGAFKTRFHQLVVSCHCFGRSPDKDLLLGVDIWVACWDAHVLMTNHKNRSRLKESEDAEMGIDICKEFFLAA